MGTSEDPSSRDRTAFLAAVLILVGTHFLYASRQDLRASFLVLVLVGGGAYLLYADQRQRDLSAKSDVQRVDRLAENDSGPKGEAHRRPKHVDPELFTLRRALLDQEESESGPDGVRIAALAKRGVVLKALASLRHMKQRSAGSLWRAVACLEDFYSRADRIRTEEEAAASLPVLMDTRAEVLNSIQTLVFVNPGSRAPKIDRAIRVIRRETQRCVSSLVEKFRDVPSVSSRDWRPPYPLDPRRDAAYSVAGY